MPEAQLIVGTLVELSLADSLVGFWMKDVSI